jgi:hypothetical protein
MAFPNGLLEVLNGALLWRAGVNSNFQTLDQYRILHGLFASRPVAGQVGRWYFSTDFNRVDYDNGTNWVGLSAAPTPLAVAADYSQVETDTLLLASAAATDVTITLLAPDAPHGYPSGLVVKRMSNTASDIILDPGAGVTIDGAATLTLTIQYTYVRLFPASATLWVKL